MRWQTDKLVEEIKALNIEGVKAINQYSQGGDYDSDNIVINLDNDEQLFMMGWPDNSERWETNTSPSDCEVAFISLEDGLDSNGGLNSTEELTGLVYLKIRQWLLKKPVDVIRTYREVY